MGYFPCAPKRPSLAFKIRLLEFIGIHTLNVAPNITAWATSLQQFWARRGYTHEFGVSFCCNRAFALANRLVRIHSANV